MPRARGLAGSMPARSCNGTVRGIVLGPHNRRKAIQAQLAARPTEALVVDKGCRPCATFNTPKLPHAGCLQAPMAAQLSHLDDALPCHIFKHLSVFERRVLLLLLLLLLRVYLPHCNRTCARATVRKLPCSSTAHVSAQKASELGTFTRLVLRTSSPIHSVATHTCVPAGAARQRSFAIDGTVLLTALSCCGTLSSIFTTDIAHPAPRT